MVGLLNTLYKYKHSFRSSKLTLSILITLILFVSNGFAANVILNGNFSSGTTNWTNFNVALTATMSSDATLGNPSPSLKGLTGEGDQETYEFYHAQTISTTINSTDTVYLSLWVRREAINGANAASYTSRIDIKKPSGGVVTIWQTSTTFPQAGVGYIDQVTDSLVSSYFDENGTYDIRLYSILNTANINPKRDPLASAQVNWDNIVLDVRVPVVNQPPVVTDIPNQSVSEGTSFTTITLDNYVSDPDNTDAQMTWTYSGNTELTVDITSRIATITAPSVDWNGSEVITFRATDPGLLWSEDAATFTVTPQNDPPVVTDIPNQTIAEGSTFTTITLDNYVSDVDNTDAEMTWTYSGNTELIVDITSRIATITIPDINWNGAEVITFRATDPGLLWSEDPATFTVTPVNDPPTLVDSVTAVSVTPVNRIGGTSTVISATFTDVDQPAVGVFNATFKIREPNNITELTLVNNQPHGSGGLTIVDNGGGSYTASYTYNPDDAQTTGLYDLYFEVTDGSTPAIDNYDKNLDELEINEVVNDPPVVTDIPNQTIAEGSTFTTITLDNYVSDPDNTDAEMNWTYSGNTELTVDITSRIATITIPDINWNGSEVITFRATDPGTLWDEDPATFSVTPVNDPPTLVDSVTAVSISPVDRLGANSTVISATFTDVDEPAVGVFNATFKIRYPNNITELTLVNNQPHGSGGLTIVNNGGGSYTASYTYNPDDAQTQGLYDLYFEVTDGSTPAIDNYDKNLDELEINEAVVNQPPVVTDIPNQTIAEGSTFTTITLDNYVSDPDNTDAEMNWTYSGNTELTVDITSRIATITIPDINWNGSEAITFRATDPGTLWDEDPATFTVNPQNDPPIVTNIPNQTILEGQSFATITLDDYVSDVDNTDAEMTWTYSGNTELIVDITSRIATITKPGPTWNGSEIITFRATDPGTLWDEDPATFTVQSVNSIPTIVAGNTSVVPSSVARTGASTTTFSVDFTDTDAAGINDFTVIFKARAPFGQGEEIVADSIQHGVGGLTVTDNGGGSYTATISWNPPDTAILGYYDLYTKITDGIDNGEDFYADNSDELLLTNAGENAPPIVQSDATTASPAGIERVGTNLTTISTIFQDGDSPGINAFTVNYKLRKPDNITDTALVANATNGSQGLTITDGGSGIYTASITWDPPDAQDLGLYDIYFDVSDGTDTASDGYSANADEIEVYDAAANNSPTLVSGNTFALPDSISRVGTDFIMIKGTFADPDFPGIGAFSITIKVQDPSLTEYTIINAASNGLQGLKVIFNGTNYEASVLWDPPDAQPTGLYDLYFFVDDNNGGTVSDGYGNNVDELNITSATPLGDGNLLRRTLGDGMCGGSNSACHNISTHASQACLTCHTPHGTPNIYLIRDTITTPSSGDREVIFKTVGIGDPYNDPDPVQGDNNHGAMADDSNTVQTEICEVCHVDPIKYYRNDDSHTQRKHNNIQNCVASCHPHDGGFSPSGGGESSGGDGCGCHSGILTPLTTSTTSYHHQLTNDNANYSAAAKTCLICHVHHDIFRDDLNSGVGAQRAKNLRVSINTTPVQGSSTVFLNSDYQSTGDGGICLSCHTSAQTKGYTQPDGTTQTPAISKSAFDAATTSHNYNANSSYGDGSTFNANCVKCHNDDMSKSKQTSTVKFSTHDSQYRRILDATGVTTPSDPLEEDFCFTCHSTTSNPNAGSNLDKYGVKAMSASALAIETAFNRTYGHPTTDSSGVHQPGETSPSDFADGNRHAECSDCHNPHAVQQGTHDGSSNLVSNALKGTWGVEPTTWPSITGLTYPNNGNIFLAPSAYTVVNPAQKEYQICLKCHSNYTTLPSGNRNLAEEINPNYPSTHGITIANQNSYCNSTTMFEPWGTSGSTYCSDCHRSSISTDPEGPHGSNAEHLLVATIVSDDVNGTPLCDVCHRSTVYWTGSSAPSRYSQHPSTKSAHKLPKGCFSCHMWDYAYTSGLGVQTSEVFADGELFVHGQNKKFVFKDDDGSTGTGNLTDAFCNGYLADVDYIGFKCWSDEDATQCSHGHNGTNY